MFKMIKIDFLDIALALKTWYTGKALDERNPGI
jgi:hypothetical protein